MINLSDYAKHESLPMAQFCIRLKAVTKLKAQTLAKSGGVKVGAAIRYIIEKHVDAELKAARKGAK